MMVEDYLPKLPPLGDVTTELGIFRLAVSRIIHKLDDHLRYCYPDAIETVEIFLSVFSSIVDEPDEDRLQRQLISVETTTYETYSACTNPECAADNRHELMKDVVDLLKTMPHTVFDECMSRGVVVGQSMN